MKSKAGETGEAGKVAGELGEITGKVTGETCETGEVAGKCE